MSLNLLKTVFDFLKDRPGKKFTAREISLWIFQNFPEACKEKQIRSTAVVNPLDSESALLQQIVAEIGAQRPRMQQKHPGVKTTEGRPRKYYYSEESDEAELSVAEEIIQEVDAGKPNRVTEHQLYPMLASYLWTEFGKSIYSKRIDERRSQNNKGPNGNKWLYPDVVALEDLSADWTQEVKDCVSQCSDKKSDVWSFEVKLLINRSNVRESYFQAVSNSTWANLGYLVAAEIEGVETMKELRLLSSLHGVGVIKLDSENVSESQIIIPAEYNETIDWNTANRLVSENKDFAEFIKLVKEFYQTGNPRKKEWDIPDLDN